MAIKIIGNEPDPEIVKRVTCRSCGARLEYVPADQQEGSRTDYTGDTDYHYFIKCPKCSAEVFTSHR